MMLLPSRLNGQLITSLALLLVVTVIFIVYWPVYYADFIWDDKVYLFDPAWMQGSDWARGTLTPVAGSKNYFRPLVLAFFVGQMRLFDAMPGPMHLISVGIHAANTVLVALLARRLTANPNSKTALVTTAVTALAYGLHPLLVEPVAWISCQFDLVVTFFTFLGLLSNVALRSTLARSIAVGICFFLAANSKESAISFPILLVVIDWVRGRDVRPNPLLAISATARLQQQWQVYASVLLAGVAYLVFRRWGLGYLVDHSTFESLGLWSRFQLVCFTYVTYWKAILWPMQGLSPLHIIPMETFAAVSFTSVTVDAGAIALCLMGLLLFWKRAQIGGFVVGVSVALLPVLNVFPVLFDDSFYHDRFATMPTAVACAFFPAVMVNLARVREGWAGAFALGAPIVLVWLGLAVLNVRVTLPQWSNVGSFWNWVLRDHPDSIVAQDNLLAYYIDQNDLARARKLAGIVKTSCGADVNCMLNVAQLAILEHDPNSASTALQQVRQAMQEQGVQPFQVVDYVVLTGHIRRLEGDLAGAEDAYRDAMSLDTKNATTHISLATVLVEEGKADEARSEADVALSLFPPSARQQTRAGFEQILGAETEGAAHDKGAEGN